MGGGCAPLPGPFVQMQRVQPSSPNVWRSEAVSEAVHAAGNHVALVPLHLISQHWWSAMRGAMSNAFPEPKTPTFVDCTHYCLTPYLLQPLWWAVCVAATGDAVSYFASELEKRLAADGLSPAPGHDANWVVAQYDAIFSVGDRRNEIWIPLAPGHLWD